MSWGVRITVLYMSFVTLILSLVYITTKNKDELESKDYYRQELDYQNKIDAIRNANNLATPVSYEVKGKAIVIAVPAELRGETFKGEVFLFKPSDSTKDLTLNFTPDADGKALVESSKIQPGVYKMKITISNNNKKYIKEEVINIH
jgi:hypothetical protein